MTEAQKAGCREPNFGFSFAINIENCSESESPGAVGTRKTCSGRISVAAMLETTSLTRWQE